MDRQRWFYYRLDKNLVTCSGCRKHYAYKNVKRKNKCPDCKLDNNRCRRVKSNGSQRQEKEKEDTQAQGGRQQEDAQICDPGTWCNMGG